MFGFVVANTQALTAEQQARYRSCYCGLCGAIRRRHGQIKGLTLTYDLTLLPLLLGALYQPQEWQQQCRCVIHPAKKQPQWGNIYTDYAADMNVILAYYKLMDDWQDDRALLRLGAAACLKSSCKTIEAAWPRQCKAIRDCLTQLSRLEKQGCSNPDQVAHWFGVLMGELFWLEQDQYTDSLRRLGYSLGKFIYLQDASVDLHADLKKERYNPLAFVTLADHRPLLVALIGEATAALEALPLGRDVQIIRNILYSGVWTRYEQQQAQKNKGKEKLSHEQ